MRTSYSPFGRNVASALAILLFAAFIATSGCKKDDAPSSQTNSITEQFTTADPGGVVALEGNQLIITPNAIPALANGQAATVSFSIETGGALPKALPSGMKLVGKTVHFGPEGFIFQEPLFVTFRLPDGTALDQVSIIGFDNATQSFGALPITYYDPDSKEVGAMVYELGHYMLANIQDLNRTRSPFGSGGFRVNSFNTGGWYPQQGGNLGWAHADTYQKLIITGFTPKYPEDMALWVNYDPNTNGGRRYWEAQTPPQVTGWKPDHTRGITFMGPQGSYTAVLINSHKYGQQDLPECKEYSIPLTFTINEPVTCSSGTSCSGWANEPVMNMNGTWSPVSCTQFKPSATIPVCTGEFQATLTWFNGSGSYGDSDLDLHLYGPNGLHAYWSNKNPGLGGITLDRDMIDETGWVQENICAPTLGGMPRGEYRLEVDLFGGQDKEFQVRVLRGSTSNSFTGKVTSADPTKRILTFTL